MKKTQPHNWSYFIYYTLGSILFLGLLFVVAEMFFPATSPELIPRRDSVSARFISNPSWDTRPQDTPGRDLSNPAREKILLSLNHEKTIGRSKIIYRGLEGDSKFKMDVVIPELDPQAFYGYRFPIDDARQGFRLIGQNFKLISARKTAIQIWHIKK
jgi:hypothetical protein